MIKRFFVETSCGQIHGRRAACGGDAVVLLHRTPVASESFTLMMTHLASAGLDVIALDTPGFGASDMPAGEPSAADYGAWLLEAIDALEVDAFHLAAHHTGVHFAVEIAAMAPERVRSLTLSGILFAPDQERTSMRADIADALAPSLSGEHLVETFRLMKSLFLEPSAELVHAETMAALVSGRGRDLAFNAIFAQDFEGVFKRATQDAGVRAQVVQARDDPLTLTGHLGRFQDAFPQTPVTIAGPAFLALPERQSGAFARAILAFAKETTVLDNRRYILEKSAQGYDLVRADEPAPAPGHGEVLVRVRAVSLNRRDVSVRDLSYPVDGADRFTPLSDAAGDVVAVGPGVTAWKPGDKVVSTFFQNHPAGRLTLPAVMSSLGAGGPGVFADHVVLAEQGLLAMPEGWSYEEAACLPCAGVTAWSALKTLGRLEAGDDVAVVGTGGVALFAVQIAAASGARVIVLSSSDEKIERARALGAAEGINYRRTPEWADALRKMTNGAGVQHVIELGGAGTLQKSIAALGLNGHLALIGALDGFGGDMSALPLIFSALRVSAVMVGSRAEQAELTAFMEAHALRPVIDQVFGFDDAGLAYARVDKGAFGKVAISLDQ